ILNLKKEVFSTRIYLERVKLQQSLAEGGSLEVYAPLKDIGRVLLANVALCLLSSICQFTLGLIAHRVAVALCLAVAAAAASMLVFSLLVISWNLQNMYEHFEQEAQAAIKALKTGPAEDPTRPVKV